jgi:hypothetical protein
MQRLERDSFAAFLEGAASAGASSEEVAATVVATLRGIDQALTPIVARRGMAALYERSLHRTRVTYPWLPIAGEEPAGREADLAALAAALTQALPAEACAAGIQLLESLRALLSTLIGESLTERLLRPVWTTLLSGPPAWDTKS